LSPIQQLALVAALALSCLGSASAQTFQGRLANGAPSATCTVSGVNKCTSFFNPSLNITILNNWSLGQGFWSSTAAPGSVQALAATAGLSATGLTGWVLPSGNGDAAAGAQNQYLSIWNSVGSSFAGLSGQFDGVQTDPLQAGYWSGTELAPSGAWLLNVVNGMQRATTTTSPFFALAVLPGDVAAIPEPQTYAMLLAGLSAVVVAVRRRRAVAAAP